ncbi:Uncharacterised protein [Burkholderia pseudomallei]|nr:Uncharacterised protein [Burkholderia pseudomallei]
MQPLRGEEHILEALFRQHAPPRRRIDAGRAGYPQIGVLVHPPAVQQPERHMAEQRLDAQFVQDQQAARAQRRLHVAQRAPDVARRVQHVGRDRDVIAAARHALRGDRLVDVEDPGRQERRARRVMLARMQQKSVRQIRIPVFAHRDPLLDELAQQAVRRSARARAHLDDVERAPERARIRQHRVVHDVVEQIGLAIALVQPLDERHAGAREHHVGRAPLAAEKLGQRAQADVREPHRHAPLVVVPRERVPLPVLPDVRRRRATGVGERPGRRVARAVAREIAEPVQHRPAFVEPPRMARVDRARRVEIRKDAREQAARDQRLQLGIAERERRRLRVPAPGARRERRLQRGRRRRGRRVRPVAAGVMPDPVRARVADEVRPQRLEHRDLADAAGEQPLQRRHALVGLDRAEARARHAPAIGFVADHADAAPVAPVHHLDGIRQRAAEMRGERVLERATRRVVRLSGRLAERRDRREEQHEIERIAAEDLGDAHADIRLRSPRGQKARLVHRREARIRQHDRGMHDAARRQRAAVPAQRGDPLARRRERRALARVRAQVDGRRAVAREPLALAADLLVLVAAPDPDDPRLIALHHPAAPDFADPARAADHHVDAARLHMTAAVGQRVDRGQLAGEPAAAPIGERIAARIEARREHRVDRPRLARGHVEQADTPVPVLLRHRADEPMHARVRRRRLVDAARRVRFARDDRPVERLAAVARREQQLDDPEQLQHPVLLRGDDRVAAQPGARVGGRLRRRDPDELVDRRALGEPPPQRVDVRLLVRAVAAVVGRILLKRFAAGMNPRDLAPLRGGAAEHEHARAGARARRRIREPLRRRQRAPHRGSREQADVAVGERRDVGDVGDVGNVGDFADFSGVGIGGVGHLADFTGRVPGLGSRRRPARERARREPAKRHADPARVVAHIDIDALGGRLARVAARRRSVGRVARRRAQPCPRRLAAAAENLDRVERERQIRRAARRAARALAQADRRLQHRVHQARMQGERPRRARLGGRQAHPREHAGRADGACFEAAVARAVIDAGAREAVVPDGRIDALGRRERVAQRAEIERARRLRDVGAADRAFAVREPPMLRVRRVEAERAFGGAGHAQFDADAQRAVGDDRPDPAEVPDPDRIGRAERAPRGLVRDLQVRDARQHAASVHPMVGEKGLVAVEIEQEPAVGGVAPQRMARFGAAVGRRPVRLRRHARRRGLARRRRGLGDPVALARERIAGQMDAARRAARVKSRPVDRRALHPRTEQRLMLAVREPDVDEPVEAVRVGRAFAARRADAAAVDAVARRLARDERGEPRLELRERRDDEADTLAHRLAAHLQRIGEIRQPRRRRMRGRLAPLAHEREQCARVIGEPLRIPRGQQHGGRLPVVARARVGLGILLEHDVRVHAADAERAHARAARLLAAVAIDGTRPRGVRADDAQRPAVERDVRIELVAMQALREPPVRHLQQHLDHAGHAGGQLQMADVALHGADRARAGNVGGAFLALRAQQRVERLRERVDLDRIAELRAGAVRLDVTDAARVDAGSHVRLHDHVALRGRVRRGERARPAVVIDRAAADHAVDRVAFAPRVAEPLQEQHADALAAHEAVGAARERLAAAVGREHARLAEPDMRVRRQDRLHAADERHVGVAAAQADERAVHRDERRRTGRLDRLARAVQIEQVADPVQRDRRHDPEERVALDPLAGLPAQIRVAALRDAREQRGPAAGERGGVVAGVLDRPPRVHQQQPVRGIEQIGLLRREAEEQRIEFRDAVDEAAPLAVRLAGLVLRIAEVRAPVPAVRGNLADAVPAVEQIAAEFGHVARAGKAAADADDRDVVVGRRARAAPGVPCTAGLRRRLVRRRRCGGLDARHRRRDRLEPGPEPDLGLGRGRGPVPRFDLGVERGLGPRRALGRPVGAGCGRRVGEARGVMLGEISRHPLDARVFEEQRRIQRARRRSIEAVCVIEPVADRRQRQRVESVFAEVLARVDFVDVRPDHVGDHGLQACRDRVRRGPRARGNPRVRLGGRGKIRGDARRVRCVRCVRCVRRVRRVRRV